MKESRDNYREHSVVLSDGRRLGYAEYGDPNGKPIIYFHGGLSCRIDISFTHAMCQDLGVRLIAPDRPGIGLSQMSPGRSLLSWADDVDQLSEILNINRFPVLGWSLGGPYALACAHRLADKVSVAGTIGGVGPMDTPGAIQELGMIEDQWLLTCPPQLRWLLGMALNSMALLPPKWLYKALEKHLKSPSDLQIIKSMSLEESSAFFIESMKQGANGHLDDYAAAGNSWNFDVSEINIPVFMWQGDEDNIVPVSAAKDLHERVTTSKLLVVPQHGHFLIHRKFSEIAKTLLE